MSFNHAEHAACTNLVNLAIEEDLRDVGDLTCAATIPPDLRGEANFVSRSAGVVSGLLVPPIVYARTQADVQFIPFVEDGARLTPGTPLAVVRGSMAAILSTERIVLNFLQRLSGVASLTRKYVDLVADLPVLLLDTRKTTPGWRLLEKYAVRCRGGPKPRMG